MTARPILALAAALLCLGAGAASADPQAGGVRIEGPVTIQTVVGSATNMASGDGARAHSQIGSIGGGVTVRGDLNMRVRADEITNVAKGRNRKAVTSVGSVHRDAEISGRREITVSTGRIVNVPQDDEPSCVIVGSVGDVPGC